MMTAPITIFDRPLLRTRFARATKTYSDFAFLEHAMAERVLDRLDDVTRSFQTVLSLGARSSILAEALAKRSDIERSYHLSCVPAGHVSVVADEEALPFASDSVDLVLACGLHWVNDLPGTLLQVRQALKPDGFFLGAFLGADTLFELRQSLMAAEEELDGGVSPRVSPFVDVRDAGALLQRAGFALPVADIDTVTVSYATPFDLLKDLRGMGETNALMERRRTPLRRQTLMRAMQHYAEQYARDDKRVTASFDIICLTGWAPDASQPKALRPGSASARLADALETEETELDDQAGGR